ncbi:putative quinol monooxygenase [Streptomyces sp. NPDC006296]|uniref:putative quinol monooxygenase n=1 Tax=Streptomyces sp. NPDC006296 TaxID=3156746 RepID=UPI0033AED19F
MSTDDTTPDGLVPAAVLASATPVAVYGYARARAGEESRMLGAIEAIIGLTRAEDGCEQYVVHTTPDQPGAFAFYERWSSGAHLLAHLSQPFMQTYFAAVADLVEGELEAHWLHPLS